MSIVEANLFYLITLFNLWSIYIVQYEYSVGQLFCVMT